MDKQECFFSKSLVNNLKEIMQGLTTRQPQGCNHPLTCTENFNATRELPNKAFQKP